MSNENLQSVYDTVIQDFPEYKELTGLIRGLETSLSHIEDLSRNYMEDEDE